MALPFGGSIGDVSPQSRWTAMLKLKLTKGYLMQATRQDILDFLRRHRQATVKDLGEHLGLTSTGIRQHLTVLERDGLVEAREERGHVGRPALVYRLTAKGDALFPKMYDALANAVIEEARELVGAEPLQQIMQKVAERFAAPYMPRLEGKHGSERLAEIAAIMAERGCMTDITNESDGSVSISQHACLYPNVATRNSVACQIDVELLRQFLGGDPRLTSSLLRGDDSCTYRVYVNGEAEAS
jgi:predicted ArsR family transcriptional regulator